MASEVDCAEIRWQLETWARATPNFGGSRSIDFANGWGKSGLGLRTIAGGRSAIWDTTMLRAPSPNILKKHGVEPAPERSRKTTWNEFLNRHWQQIVATDFFTVEVWTTKGLQRFVVLFFLELSTRRARPMAPQSMVTIALSSDIGNFAARHSRGLLWPYGIYCQPMRF